MTAQIFRGRAQQPPIVGELAGHQRRIVERADAHRQIEAGADQIHHAVVQMDVQPQLRMPRHEFGQQRRQVLAPERRRRGHPQRTGDLATGPAQRTAKRLQFLDEPPALLGKRRAFGRRVQPAGGPMQQPHAQILFQPLQALARHGHRQVETARRCADRAEVQHAQEQRDIADTVHDYQSNIETDS